MVIIIINLLMKTKVLSKDFINPHFLTKNSKYGIIEGERFYESRDKERIGYSC